MRRISISLPVRNIKAAKAFFSELGFLFREEAGGGGMACMVLDQNIHVMLLDEDRFHHSVDGALRHITDSAGFVISLSADSQQEVDHMVARAIAAGGKPWPILEQRPLYSGSFQDLDGHVWQLTCGPERCPD
jgi:predicted lactoylglutathione lyase